MTTPAGAADAAGAATTIPAPGGGDVATGSTAAPTAASTANASDTAPATDTSVIGDIFGDLGDLGKAFSEINDIVGAFKEADAIAVGVFDAVTDKYFWISLGWLTLGSWLVVIGAIMLAMRNPTVRGAAKKGVHVAKTGAEVAAVIPK